MTGADQVRLDPDEVAALFDAPAEVGFHLAPSGAVLPLSFVEDRRCRQTNRGELQYHEIALLLGVTRDTVYRWRSRGELSGRYAVIGGKRAVLIAATEVARRQKAAGYTVPVRETPEQFERRGRREQAALLKKLSGE